LFDNDQIVQLARILIDMEVKAGNGMDRAVAFDGFQRIFEELEDTDERNLVLFAFVLLSKGSGDFIARNHQILKRAIELARWVGANLISTEDADGFDGWKVARFAPSMM
jgi:hypothetical protein